MKNISRNTIAAALVILLINGIFLLPLSAKVITIMAANTTSGNLQLYEDPGIRIFMALRPDIVLIQEFQYDGTLRSLVNIAFGPEYYFMVEDSDFPNGVISRWPIIDSGQWEDPHAGNRDFAWAVIDIPGEKKLQVVSVHLRAGQPALQNLEAQLIRDYVAANFDDDHYIVVGGDLNTNTRNTDAINTFKTFLAADTHTPVDRNGNSATNQPRNRDYDWVMPNATLDQFHTTLYVGASRQPYPEGIVFDSRVFEPLSDVFPVQYEDSDAFQMQHMAVMKAFNIPGDNMIEEGFDGFQNGVRPAGWTFENCGENEDTYTAAGYFGRAAPALKLSAPEAAVVTPTFSITDPEYLTFWARGVDTDFDSSLLVEEFYGSGWGAVTAVTALPAAGEDLGPFPLSAAASRVKFTYTGTSGSLAFDDVRITGPQPATDRRPWITDYNGDGTSDIAVYRPASGLWAVRGITRVYFGGGGDVPVPGDYSGDGTTEIAIFRESSGLWAVRGGGRTYFGTTGDVPLPRDYSGNGKTEVALFRPASGLWAVRQLTRIYFGSPGDIPVPGYYGGAAAAPGIYRPSSGLWALRGVTRLYFGSLQDTPVPGDYSGDGLWTPAIFRPASGLWAVEGGDRVYFGGSGDAPLPGDYAGDGRDRVGIFRKGSGLWGVRQTTRIYFGSADDIPVTR